MGDPQTVFYIIFAALGILVTIALAGVGWLLASRARSEQNQREDIRTLWVELSALKDKIHAHELAVKDKYTPIARTLEIDKKLTEAVEQLTRAVTQLNINMAAAGVIPPRVAGPQSPDRNTS